MFKECIAKKGRLICRKPTVAESGGLLCAEHLKLWKNGDGLKFKARLPGRAVAALARLRSHPSSARTGPQGSSSGPKPQPDRQARPDAPAAARPIQGVITNPLGVTAATSALLAGVYDAIWRATLGLPIGLGTGVSSSIGAFSGWASGTFLSLLVLYVLFFLFLYGTAYLIGTLLSVFSKPSLLILALLIRRAGRKLWQIHPTISFFVSGKIAGFFGAPNVEARISDLRSAFEKRAAKSKRTSEILLKRNLRKARRVFRKSLKFANKSNETTTRIMFDKEITWPLLVARTVMLLGVTLLAGGLVFKASSALKADLSAKKACEPAGFPAPVFWPEEKIALVKCGYLVLKGSFPVEYSGLTDASWRPQGPRILKPVFYLGAAGDWAVIAPLEDPGQRVLLRSSLIEEFSGIPPAQSGGDPAVMAAFWSALDNAHRPARRTLVQWAKLAQLSGVATAWPYRRQSVPIQDATVPAFVNAQLASQQALILELSEKLAKSSSPQALSIWFSSTFEHSLGDVTARLEQVTQDLRDLPSDHPRSTFSHSPEIARLLVQSDLFRNAADQFGPNLLEACFSAENIRGYVEFSEGSTVFENPLQAKKLLEDIRRTIAQASETADIHHLVVLVGSASGTGSQAANRNLAERRAEVVRRELVKGIGPQQALYSEDKAHLHMDQHGLFVLPVSRGETLRKVKNGKAVSPRHVEVRVCKEPKFRNSPELRASGDVAGQFR